jgi:hypothetical protein
MNFKFILKNPMIRRSISSKKQYISTKIILHSDNTAINNMEQYGPLLLSYFSYTHRGNDFIENSGSGNLSGKEKARVEKASV